MQFVAHDLAVGVVCPDDAGLHVLVDQTVFGVAGDGMKDLFGFRCSTPAFCPGFLSRPCHALLARQNEQSEDPTGYANKPVGQGDRGKVKSRVKHEAKALLLGTLDN